MDRDFSVVIPALNEEKYLPVLLSSLSSQKIKNLEVIVVDGESDDLTKEKALEFKDKLDLKLLKAPKRNLSYQRNLGFSKSKGQYAVFLDADFRVSANFFQELLKTIAKTKADMILPIAIPETKKAVLKAYFNLLNTLSPLTFISKKPLAVWGGVCVARKLFGEIGGFDETIFVPEDQHFIQEAVKRKGKIVLSRKAKVFFSTRRIDKYGFFSFLCKTSFAALHQVLKGPIRKEMYKYNMGGQEF